MSLSHTRFHGVFLQVKRVMLESNPLLEVRLYNASIHVPSPLSLVIIFLTGTIVF